MGTTFDDATPTVDGFTRAVSGNALSVGSQSQIVNNHSDAIEAVETGLIGYSVYAPTPAGNGLSVVTSTWAGLYKRRGSEGRLRLNGEVKGNWAGSGYLSVPLPSGWTCSFESIGKAWGNPMPNPYGTHWKGVCIAHAGETELRIIASTGSWVAQDAPGYCTATASTDLFACGTDHGLGAGDRVVLGAATSSGVAAGLTIGTTYYVISSGLTTTAFKLSTTSGGSAVNITADGTAFVIRQAKVSAVWDLAIDGQNAPPGAAFTGDGTSPNDDMIHCQIDIDLH